MRGPCLHTDLADAFQRVTPLFEFFQIAVHVCLQFLDGAVLATDLSDFTAYGYGDPLRLQVADHCRQFSRQRKIIPLLIFDGGLRQINQRGGINIDIVKSGFDRLPDQVFDSLGFLFGIRGKFLRIDLEMIPLNKDRAAPSGLDGCGSNGTGIFKWPLTRIVNFRTCDFEENRSHLSFHRSAEYRLRGIVGNAAEIDCRNGKTTDFLPAHRFIERLNR